MRKQNQTDVRDMRNVTHYTPQELREQERLQRQAVQLTVAQRGQQSDKAAARYRHVALVQSLGDAFDSALWREPLTCGVRVGDYTAPKGTYRQ